MLEVLLDRINDSTFYIRFFALGDRKGVNPSHGNVKRIFARSHGSFAFEKTCQFLLQPLLLLLLLQRFQCLPVSFPFQKFSALREFLQHFLLAQQVFHLRLQTSHNGIQLSFFLPDSLSFSFFCSLSFFFALFCGLPCFFKIWVIEVTANGFGAWIFV